MAPRALPCCVVGFQSYLSISYVVEMGWMPFSLTASQCAKLPVSKHKLKERLSMGEVSIIGVDLAKRHCQTKVA
jgi:hypothetical protein